MKAAKYESSGGALSAFLSAKPPSVYVADLYTFTLNGTINSGVALTWATGDVDIHVPYGSGTVSYTRPVIFDTDRARARGHWKVGLDVDTWEVQISPLGSVLIGGQPLLSALRAGAFRGAEVLVDRAFIDSRPNGVGQGQPYLTPLGVVNIFTGRVAEIDLGRTSAVVHVNSHLDLLTVAAPRSLFQAGCRWTLFDAGCGLTTATYAVSGTAAANTTTNDLQVSLAAPSGSGTYALGRVTMTSGPNKGFSRAIRSVSGAHLTLLAPFPYAVTSGDTLTAYPGCNKGMSHCNAFGNIARFGGVPFTPAPETSI